MKLLNWIKNILIAKERRIVIKGDPDRLTKDELYFIGKRIMKEETDTKYIIIPNDKWVQ